MLSSNQLLTLFLGGNQITDYSIQLQSLSILILARNNLSTFAAYIDPKVKVDQDLTVLDLSFNNIANFQNSEFKYLGFLRALFLRNNNIMELPVGIFGTLKNDFVIYQSGGTFSILSMTLHMLDSIIGFQ